MGRGCREIATGKGIEYQDHAPEGLLRENAVKAGYAPASVEEWPCTLTEFMAAVAVLPLPTDVDRFDAERWIKATNLYWLDVVTHLVAGLNQVRQNPTQTYPAATAPTTAEVKAGVVAKYQALG